MACRDDGTGVTTEAVEAALWPAGANSRRTFNNTITDARRSLGQTPDGARYLPSASDGRYRISERVKTDCELFWATVEQAENTDDATVAAGRSEERRVGKEGVSKCRARWSQYRENNTKKNNQEMQMK